MNAMTGVSNDGDAWNYRVSALGGHNFAGGRGNTTTVIEYTKSTGLRGTARSDYANQGGFEAPATPGTYQEVYTPYPTVNQLSTSGVPYLDNFFYTPGVPDSAIGITNAAGQPLAFSPGSNALTPYNLGQATGNPIFYNGGQGINLVNYSNLQAWSERVNVVSLGHFDWTDNVQSYWNGWFSDSHSHSLISQPLYNATIFGNPGTPNGPIYISTTNPYLSAANQALIQSEMNAYKAGGFALNGGTPFDPNWNYQLLLPRSRQHRPRSRRLHRRPAGRPRRPRPEGRLLRIGPVLPLGRRGQLRLLPRYLAPARGGVPEPGKCGQSSDELERTDRLPRGNSQFIYCDGIGDLRAARYLRPGRPERRREGLHHARRHGRLIQHTTRRHREPQRPHRQAARGLLEVRGSASRTGAKRRCSSLTPTTPLTRRSGISAASYIEGSYHTNEAYAETLIPIFEPQQNIMALHRVELEGAIRHVENSIAGDSNTWDAGLRWAPTQDVLFRGNRTVSIRAPAVTELFLPASTDDEFATPDPCDKNFVTQGPDPSVRAKNCAAAGINTATFTSNAINATVAGLTSGNTALQSEVAKSYTFGTVITPRWVPSLNIAMDYLSIKMSNAIEQLNLSDILEACYDSPSYPNVPECSNFTPQLRRPDHRLP